MWQLTLLLSTSLLASSAWFTMHYLYSLPVLFSFASAVSASNATVDLSWHAPPSTKVSDLKSVINGTDTWGFVFNSSKTPVGLPYCKSDTNLPREIIEKYGCSSCHRIASFIATLRHLDILMHISRPARTEIYCTWRTQFESSS